MRHIGVSNFSVAQLERAEAIAPVETLQPPYSLLDRGIERDVLPWCESVTWACWSTRRWRRAS